VNGRVEGGLRCVCMGGEEGRRGGRSGRVDGGLTFEKLVVPARVQKLKSFAAPRNLSLTQPQTQTTSHPPTQPHIHTPIHQPTTPSAHQQHAQVVHQHDPLLLTPLRPRPRPPRRRRLPQIRRRLQPLYQVLRAADELGDGFSQKGGGKAGVERVPLALPDCD